MDLTTRPQPRSTALIQGRAETIRLALHCSGIPFTDERLTGEQFAERKESLPLGQVPVLTVDDQVIPQEVAILQYIGRQSGLYPLDREEALKVDIMINVSDDIYAAMMAFYMPDNPGKEIMKKMVVEEKLPKIFGHFERHLAKCGTSFCAGDKISIADIRFYCILYTIKSGIHAGLPTNLTDKYPHISKLYQAIDTHEKVASWNQKSQAK
ncbi:hypothetical protein PCANC_15762 [Puccinia coronata f. sp. avenae]|uniref:Glutathione transferase n=1 Tax=Puccinia coronata f. sp. avenae TaxID=200324 RepID=A0A2N5TUW8_9BASI|nr:hypothetical protein PCANC_15762 [Puccinia coronata f. sp. avenae]